MKYCYPTLISLVLVSWLTFSCSSDKPDTLSETYLDSLQNWKIERVAELKSPDGFINLAGLYWLEPGENTFGSDSSNTIVAPADMPGMAGTFVVDSNKVFFSADPSATVQYQQQPVDTLTIFDHQKHTSLPLQSGSFSWIIIERAGNFGVRLRNLDHPALKDSLNLQYYPPSATWQVKATFEPYNPPKSMQIQNIVGFTYSNDVPGKLSFEIDGQPYSLEPTEVGDQLYIMFGDKSNGEETYGAGRYLYTSKPDENGEVIIDFNKAYNPPCAYTAFATCPLPPQQNRLSIKVEAGEKMYEEDHMALSLK